MFVQQLGVILEWGSELKVLLFCHLSRFSSVQSLSHVQLFATPWTTACQASLSITNSRSPPKPMSIESVMPSNHFILCHPLLLLPSIFPSIRVFSNESALHIRWPKYWNFSFSVSPSNEHRGLISFRMDWLDLLAVQLFKNDHNSHCQQAEGCIFCIFSGTWCHHFSCVLTDLFCHGLLIHRASLLPQLVKNPPAMQETLVWFLGQEDPLEKG